MEIQPDILYNLCKAQCRAQAYNDRSILDRAIANSNLDVASAVAILLWASMRGIKVTCFGLGVQHVDGWQVIYQK